MLKSEKYIHDNLLNFNRLMELNSIKKPSGFYYNSIYHFILENGSFIKSKPLTTAEKKHVENVIKKLHFVPEYKQCFYNSQMLALEDEKQEIKYVEGMAQSIIPLMHGWNTINGKVIDLTWRDEDGEFILGEFDKKRAYYGVKFSKEYIVKRMLKTGFSGSLIDNFQEKFPLLKTKFKNLP